MSEVGTCTSQELHSSICDRFNYKIGLLTGFWILAQRKAGNSTAFTSTTKNHKTICKFATFLNLPES